MEVYHEKWTVYITSYTTHMMLSTVHFYISRNEVRGYTGITLSVRLSVCRRAQLGKMVVWEFELVATGGILSR